MIKKKDPAIIQSYFEDASGLLGGHAEEVVIPDNEAEIADFLKDASARRLPVTVAGGGTGVAGSRIPFGGAVLSVESLNRVKDIRKDRMTAVAGAGVTVAELKRQVAEAGLMYPPDPTERSSFLGGNAATNASGSRGFKYGSTRRYIRRLAMVLATGDILNIARGDVVADGGGMVTIPLSRGSLPFRLPGYRLPPVKNAAGYYSAPAADLVDLFIGSEGTLGVITEIEVALLAPVTGVLGAVAFFREKENAWRCADDVKRLRRTGEAAPLLDVMAMEYFDRNALGLLREDYPAIPAFAGAALLFEQDLTGKDESRVLEAWAELLERHGAPLESVWFGATHREQEAFRDLRHRLPEKVNEIVRRNRFPKTGTDIAVPEERFTEMMRFYDEVFEGEGIAHLIFGHIGESHMHANLLPKSEEEFIRSKRMYGRLVETAVRLGGTVSAEHGIGKLKHEFLRTMVGDTGMREMARVKKTLDPALILGRNNIFPEKLLR